jgi:hypothetical protein
MVTLDVRPQEEQKTKVAVRETVDNDIDSSSVEQDRSDISTRSYSMTSPGMRYYAFTRPQAIKTAGKANACRRVRP